MLACLLFSTLSNLDSLNMTLKKSVSTTRIGFSKVTKNLADYSIILRSIWFYLTFVS